MNTKPSVVQVATIRPIAGEPTSFEVQSSTATDVWYRVCIKAHEGAGECQCIRWQTVCWPIIRDTRHLPPSRRCRHLRRRGAGGPQMSADQKYDGGPSYLIMRCAATGLFQVMQMSPEIVMCQRSTLAKAKQSLKRLKQMAEHRKGQA